MSAHDDGDEVRSQPDGLKETRGDGAGLPAPYTGPEEPGPTTLQSLIDDLRRHDEQYIAALQGALHHARQAGEVLQKIKMRVRELKANWLDWVKLNLPIDERTASMYMRIHRQWPRLMELCRQNQQAIADLTITDANRMLAKKQDGSRNPHEPEETPAEDANSLASLDPAAGWRSAIVRV